ncbi:LicD family-domain-containing protein [Xylariomycetidae sp. FL2044]|nr:LicD family-domain-containing protein [Xylariomycetidae sp. FL2044]
MHIIRPLLVLLLTCTASGSPAVIPGHPKRSSSPDNTHNDASSSPPSTTTAANQQQPPKPKPKPPPETKYFHEPGGDQEMGHYDARYFRGKVPYDQHLPALRHLIRSYLLTLEGLGAETWLAHGSLLGWWWNGRIMPWDYDLDVQVSGATLGYLGRHFNGTLHGYTYYDDDDDDDEVGKEENDNKGSDGSSAGGGSGGDDNPTTREATTSPVPPPPPLRQTKKKKPKEKQYLLDVNPHGLDPGRGNGLNVIDARWIDTSNGMFVDITALIEREARDRPGVWSCKNAHRYRTAELYPMRRTEFEGVAATVPYAFDKILTDEYGSKSLVTTEWLGHRWHPDLREWIKMPPPGADQKPMEQQDKSKNEHHDKDNVVVVVVEETVVKDV